MVTERVQFRGIDRFNRPCFKSLDKPRRFYGSADKLFHYEATETEVLEQVTEDDLSYFGSSFGCEPMGTPSGNITIVRE